MTDRRLRAAYVVPMAGGAVGAIVAAGVAAGVALSGATGSTDQASAPATTVEATVTTGDEGQDEGAVATTAVDRPAPLDVQVAWNGTVVVFAGVAQSIEQVDSLGPDAPGSVDVAGPGAVTADAEVAAFGAFLESLPEAFADAQLRLTVDSITVTGTLAPGFGEDDVVSELADVGLGHLTQQLDVTPAPAPSA